MTIITNINNIDDKWNYDICALKHLILIRSFLGEVTTHRPSVLLHHYIPQSLETLIHV